MIFGNGRRQGRYEALITYNLSSVLLSILYTYVDESLVKYIRRKGKKHFYKKQFIRDLIVKDR